MNLLVLVGSSAFATLFVQLVKKYVKEIVEPRFGTLGVQAVLVAVALLLAVLGRIVQLLPANVIETAGAIFAMSLVIYEVLVKGLVNDAIRNVK
jgi:hypothetical protein